MINYTPKPDTGKAIFDVQVTFKDKTFLGVRSKNYKYDICKPDTTHKMDVDQGTIYPLLFENERVEGLGLSVTVDIGNYLVIKDQDTKEHWVIDRNEVRDICIKTCKQVLLEEKEKMMDANRNELFDVKFVEAMLELKPYVDRALENDDTGVVKNLSNALKRSINAVYGKHCFKEEENGRV